MKVLVSGSSGLIGSALVSSLKTGGDEVVRLVRSDPKGPGEVRWNPADDFIDHAGIEKMDAVVHLAGESLADGRWTSEKKTRIRNTRIKGTDLLCRAIAATSSRPKVLISASAVGFYGDRNGEPLTENSNPGRGFLADVCRDWEAAAQPAVGAGIRVVNLRIGMVLSHAGGALAKMSLPFKMGVGGKIGSGRQYMSWIVLDDLTAAIKFLIVSQNVAGPVNAVAPNPVTNVEFTHALGAALSRPTLFAVPAFGARLAFGEMADEVLLSSTRAIPEKLNTVGFHFEYTNIDSALRHTVK